MKTGNRKAPLFEALHHFVQQDPVRFHVPGHKGSVGYHAQITQNLSLGKHVASASYFASLLPLDVTELNGLDDLHAPRDVIAQAEELAARCFHAEHTYFLVNGSTVGNLAMILAHVRPGEQVLVQRNSHKSVFHALAMAGAEAIFLEPQICPTFQVPVGISLEQVENALQYFPKVKAMHLTYPNYYGMASPLREVIALAHQQDLLVLVDEAHGAHFGQHGSLPPSAMQLGADICVQSTHKMLSSLTQTSMLHFKSKRVVKEDLEYYLHSLQSSSPSYPLMASLDLARSWLEELELAEWQFSLESYASLRGKISELSMFRISGAGKLESHPLGIAQDPFKLIIQPIKGFMTGFQLQQALETEGIYSELADPKNVLCTLPLIVNQDWNERLLQALNKLVIQGAQGRATTQEKVKAKNEEEGQEKSVEGMKLGDRKQSKREKLVEFEEPTKLKERTVCKQQLEKLSSVQLRVFRSTEKEELPIEQALGRVAAEMIIPYPPGIPMLLPGEIISQEIMEKVFYWQEKGAFFQGKGEEALKSILVVKK